MYAPGELPEKEWGIIGTKTRLAQVEERSNSWCKISPDKGMGENNRKR